jgi:hypothetical protein
MKAEKAPPWIKLVEAYELTASTEQAVRFWQSMAVPDD